MIPKPSACDGCPARGWGKYMVPDERREGAQIELWGQNPGEYEEKGARCVAKSSVGAWQTEPVQPAPFIGPTGHTLSRSYFPVAGVERGDLSLHNVIRCRQHGTNDLPELNRIETKQIIEHCQRAHYTPTNAKLVITEGAYALYAATGEDGGWNKADEKPPYKGVGTRSVDGWRGWVLPYSPLQRRSFTDIYTPDGERCVLAMFHTAFLFGAPWYIPAAKRDWARVPQILRGVWPARLPTIDPVHPSEWPAEAAFDTEFHKEYGRDVLTRYSMFTERVGSPHLWVVEASAITHWPRISVARPHMIFQNQEADVEHLTQITGHSAWDPEDIMYAHAVNWSDLDHDLDFMGSMDARINRWKHLMRTNPRVYSGGDAVGTWDGWLAAQRSFRADPDSERVYREQVLPLFPIIARARKHGVRVSGPRVLEALSALDEQRGHAEAIAQAYVGYPISLGSPQQVARWIYDVEGLGKRRK